MVYAFLPLVPGKFKVRKRKDPVVIEYLVFFDLHLALIDLSFKLLIFIEVKEDALVPVSRLVRVGVKFV